MHARTTLRRHPTSAALARRFVAGVLSEQGFARRCIEDAVLLASEVVSNAVVPAESYLDLVVVTDHPMARVEVHDGQPSPAVPREPDAERDAGLGLSVISALAEAWGVEHLGRRTCVWFEVR